MRTIVMNITNEVSVQDIETACLYLGMDLKKVEVISRGLRAYEPPRYRVEVEVVEGLMEEGGEKKVAGRAGK